MSKRKSPKNTLPAPIVRAEQFPSAQALYRFSILDRRNAEFVQAATARVAHTPMFEEALTRDTPAIQQIKATQTLAELLDLVPLSSGLAQRAWLDQMRLFRLGAAPLIAERLKAAAAIEDEKGHDIAEERLIAALHLCGDLGAEQLRLCFDTLSLYGQSLACLVLGKAKVQTAADRIWAYYQQVQDDAAQNFLIGPLWALVDLHDPRAPGALAELLMDGRDFPELYGLLALAGDAQAVWPLVVRILQTSKDENRDLVLALAAISHRLGRPALRAELEKWVAPKDKAALPDKMAETFLRYQPKDIQDYFQIFYSRP